MEYFQAKRSLKAAIKKKEQEIKLLTNSREAMVEVKTREVEKELEMLLEEEKKYWRSESWEDWLK